MEQKKIEEKKVYVAPKMDVVEYDCQGALLADSDPDCPSLGDVCTE